MADVFSVLERYVSRHVWATAVVFVVLASLVVGHPLQGLLLPMAKLGSAVVVAVVGGLVLGGVYYGARRSEEADALAVRLAKLDRLAISVAYSYQPVPRESGPGVMYHVLPLAMNPTNPAPIVTTNPPTRGATMWLECVVRNVGDDRLEDIVLPYSATFFRGAQLKTESIAGTYPYPVNISFMGPGDTYKFYMTNADSLNVSVNLPDGARARPYNEPAVQGIRLRRAPESNVGASSNALLPGPLPSPKEKP